jgi:cell division septum initiation protein DivIVA
MDENTLFRSALRGFNREDVMEYITKTSRKHEAEVLELRSELERTQTQLADVDAERSSLQDELSGMVATHDQLLQVSQELGETLNQLSDAKSKIADLERQLAQCQTDYQAEVNELTAQRAAELAQVRSAGEEALRQYADDAEGYTTLVDQVGRVILNAERTAERTRSEAQEEAQKIVSDAQTEADNLLEEATATLDQARQEAAAIRDRAEDYFRQSRDQFEVTQSVVGNAVSQAMDEVDRLRSALLDLNDSFASTRVSFEAPAYPEDAVGAASGEEV